MRLRNETDCQRLANRCYGGRVALWLMTVAIFLAAMACSWVSAAEQRPNVIFFYADDLGYGSSESTNLANERPQIVESLRKALMNWYRELPLVRG